MKVLLNFARQGFFPDSEFRAILDHLPAYLCDFARFGYLTGWRKGEIAALRWEDVAEDVIRPRGEDSKNGQGRTITADGELAELVAPREKSLRTRTEHGHLAKQNEAANASPVVRFVFCMSSWLRGVDLFPSGPLILRNLLIP